MTVFLMEKKGDALCNWRRQTPRFSSACWAEPWQSHSCSQSPLYLLISAVRSRHSLMHELIKFYSSFAELGLSCL